MRVIVGALGVVEAAGVGLTFPTGNDIRFLVSWAFSCAVAAPAANSSKIMIGLIMFNGSLFAAKRKSPEITFGDSRAFLRDYESRIPVLRLTASDFQFLIEG